MSLDHRGAHRIDCIGTHFEHQFIVYLHQHVRVVAIL
jgi:hypothetical protein